MLKAWVLVISTWLFVVSSQSELPSESYEYDSYSSYVYGYYGYEIEGITFENEWGEEPGLYIGPDWTNWNVEIENGSGIFSCFNQTERAVFRDMFQVTELELDLNGKTRFFSDLWGFGSLAVDIILREIFGFQINITGLYPTAIPMMENSWQFPVESGLRVPFFHLELWASDFEFWDLYRYASPEIDISLMGTPYFYVIMVREEILVEVEAVIGDSTTFLDVWRTFLDPKVVDAMASPESIDNMDGALCDKYQWTFSDCFDIDVSEYTGVEGAVLLNGTYYPPQCPVGNASDCMVLISFLPDYTLHLHADLIAQYDLKWVVKYIGGEWASDSLALFEELYGHKRVLFEAWLPSVFVTGDWRLISVPVKHPFAKQDQIFRGVSSRMAFVSRFAHNLISSGFIMNSQDYDIMNEYILEEGGIYETDHLPVSCRWLKEHESSWMSWIDLEQKPKTETLCDRVTDATLQKLLDFQSLSDLELEGEVMKQGAALFNALDSSIADLYSIQYVMTQCFKPQDDSDAALQWITGTLAVIGWILMIIALTFIIRKKEEKVIKSSSLVMLITIVFGGSMGLVYPFLNDTSVLINCYLQPVVFQMSFVLIIGSISMKTWRLGYYIKMANALQKPKIINDLNLMIRGLCLVSVVGIYLLVLFLVYPLETEEIIFEAQKFVVCSHPGRFTECYLALLLLECVQLIVVAQSVWSLRSLSAQFNESKWISVIMYHSCVFIVALIVIDEDIVEMNPIQIYFAKSIIVELFVFVSVFGLLIPKFVMIVKDVKFSGDIVAKDMIHIDTNAMTKEDVKKIRRLLTKFGYELRKRGSVQLSKTNPFDSSKGSISAASGRFVSQETIAIEMRMNADEARETKQETN